MNILLLFCSILIFFIACSSGPKTPPKTSQNLPTSTTQAFDSMPSEPYKNLATQKYGQNVSYVYNQSKTCVLCLKTAQNLSQKGTYQNRAYFFLYDLENDRILLEESLENATVRWFNDHQLQVSITPGIVKGNEEENDELGYIYDLKLQKKIHQTNSGLPRAK